MSTPILSELLKLSDEERLELAQELWDSIPAESNALAPADEQVQEWERRLAEHDADPSTAIPWEEARAELRKRYGV